MKKIYRIYELIDTSLESKSVCEEYGYGRKTLNSLLYREIDDRGMGWDMVSQLSSGFDTLESAESFVKNNIKSWETWVIVCEYKKEE